MEGFATAATIVYLTLSALPFSVPSMRTRVVADAFRQPTPHAGKVNTMILPSTIIGVLVTFVSYQIQDLEIITTPNKAEINTKWIYN